MNFYVYYVLCILCILLWSLDDSERNFVVIILVMFSILDIIVK